MVLTGCARFTPQPLSPGDRADQFERRSLSGEALRRYAETHLGRAFPSWPPPAWDLETLTLAAFYFNPDLAAARAGYAAVAAGEATAAQLPNPTVSVNPVYNTTTALPTPWLVTAALDVPLETAGKRGHRRARAAHLAEAARLAVGSAVWETRLRLRLALLEWWSADQSAPLLCEQEEAHQALARLLKAELAAGGITPLEVSRERLAREQTKLARLDALSRRAQARTQLAAAIGVPASALEGLVISSAAFDFRSG